MKIYCYGLAEMRHARIPLRFWIDGEPDEHLGETLGIALRHAILRSAMDPLDGMRLRVKFRFATGDASHDSSELDLLGWVVGVSKLPGGKFGTQVELE
jgi:hypothetical protein